MLIFAFFGVSIGNINFSKLKENSKNLIPNQYEFSDFFISKAEGNLSTKFFNRFFEIYPNYNDIKNENNDVLKVWYCYFCWAGYWFGHKQGIRRGKDGEEMGAASISSPPLT